MEANNIKAIDWHSLPKDKSDYVEFSDINDAIEVAQPDGVIAMSLHTFDNHVQKHKDLAIETDFNKSMRGRLGSLGGIELVTDAGNTESWFKVNKFYVPIHI